MNIEDPKGLARLVIEALERLDIPYMVTGSVASFLHGEPRATNDLDIVISPAKDSLQNLLETLEPHAYVSRDAALDAFRRHQMFNAIGFETSEKIDFIFLRDRPYDRASFGRRQRKGFKTLQFVTSTAEDSILSKLSWARRSESERQLRDVYGILRNRSALLDWEYLDRWAPELGVVPLLDQLRKDLDNDMARE